MSFTGKPSLANNIIITNDSFWLDLDLGEFLKNYRIPAEYTTDTISYGVKVAVLAVNPELEPVKNIMVHLGYANLEAYTVDYSELLDGEQTLVMRYKKAVFSHAKAYLLEQFNSMNRRKDAENAAKEAPETAEFWLNQSQREIYFLTKHFMDTKNINANHGVYVALI